MSQARIKNHHFVPKILQRAFLSSGERIWYSERSAIGTYSTPEERNIEKTFRIRDFYTIYRNGRASDVVEREFYGKIDDYLGRLIPPILREFEKNLVPTFSGVPLDSLRRVVFELIKRTPHFYGDFDELETGKTVLQAELEHYITNQNAEEAERVRRDMEDIRLLRLLGRTVRIQSITEKMPSAHAALEEFHARWAVSRGRHSFVLSDMIAYRIGNGGHNGLANPNMEIWMPISPKIALVLTRDPNGKIPLVLNESRDHIRQVNEYAAANSDRLGSHSFELLSSVIAS